VSARSGRSAGDLGAQRLDLVLQLEQAAPQLGVFSVLRWVCWACVSRSASRWASIIDCRRCRPASEA
jgi:hypothetical protein